MRYREFFVEASGGLARRWLEKQQGKDTFFLDPKNNRWDLEDVSFWPADPDLAYQSDETTNAVDKMNDEINAYLAKKNLKTVKVISPKTATSKQTAAMVVVVSHGNERIAYVKHVDHKHSVGVNPITWTNTAFQTATGLALQSAQMKKAAVPLDPADIITPGSMYGVDNLIGAVSNKMAGANVPEALKTGASVLLTNVKEGKKDPVPGVAEHKPVVEIKLGEIAAPIALVTGNFVSGAYAQANKELITPMGGTWQTSKGISFPDKAEMLIDSYLHFPNGVVGISSKDASGGAKPSVKIIVETLEQKQDEFDSKFLQKNSSIIEVLKDLDSKSAVDGVLNALQMLENTANAISPEDIKWFRSIYGKGNVPLESAPESVQQFIKASRYQRIDYNHPEYQLGYHVLAIWARALVDEINRDRNAITNFFKTILNKSNMVQVLARTKATGDALAYDNFNVIWPPVFTGSILANADSYTSRTRPTRKIAFEFK